MDLNGKRVLITGVGIKPIRYVFKDITTGEPSHTPVFDGDVEYKANIGAATAFECARAGAVVHLVARTEQNLQIVKTWIEKNVSGSRVECTVVDLSEAAALRKLVDSISDDLPLYWVQSVGVGAGTVRLKDDNPYLRIENISDDLIDAELSVLKNTAALLRLFLPRFREQEEARVCVISSMSAVRSVISGSAHMAAKGAISRFANAAMIELDQDRIFVTDVRPGIVDTGMYDAEGVRETVSDMGKKYGYDYSKTDIFCAPPSAVGKAVLTALASDAHILSIDMVARGQWPHDGS